MNDIKQKIEKLLEFDWDMGSIENAQYVRKLESALRAAAQLVDALEYYNAYEREFGLKYNSAREALDTFSKALEENK